MRLIHFDFIADMFFVAFIFILVVSSRARRPKMIIKFILAVHICLPVSWERAGQKQREVESTSERDQWMAITTERGDFISTCYLRKHHVTVAQNTVGRPFLTIVEVHSLCALNTHVKYVVAVCVCVCCRCSSIPQAIVKTNHIANSRLARERTPRAHTRSRAKHAKYIRVRARLITFATRADPMWLWIVVRHHRAQLIAAYTVSFYFAYKINNSSNESAGTGISTTK